MVIDSPMRCNSDTLLYQHIGIGNRLCHDSILADIATRDNVEITRTFVDSQLGNLPFIDRLLAKF